MYIHMCMYRYLTESQGKNLAGTVLCVPSSLDALALDNAHVRAIHLLGAELHRGPRRLFRHLPSEQGTT